MNYLSIFLLLFSSLQADTTFEKKLDSFVNKIEADFVDEIELEVVDDVKLGNEIFDSSHIPKAPSDTQKENFINRNKKKLYSALEHLKRKKESAVAQTGGLLNYIDHNSTTTRLNNALFILRKAYCRNSCKDACMRNDVTYPQTDSQVIKQMVHDRKEKTASLRQSSRLAVEEEQFRKKRLMHVAQSLKGAFAGLVNDFGQDSYAPTIGVCASGGGFRAMIATMGLYEAFGSDQSEDTPRVLDCITYASCLSGSTWFTIPRALGIPHEALKAGYKKYALIPVDLSPSAFKKMTLNSLIMPQSKTYPEKFSYNGKEYFYNYFDELASIRSDTMRLFLWDIPLSAVTLYGKLIAHMVLSPFDDPEIYDTYVKGDVPRQARQQVLYSQAKHYLESKDCSRFPLPIGTMVAPLDNVQAQAQRTPSSPYVWLEATPYELGFDYYAGNHYTGAYIPTWAVGRKFGKLTLNQETQSWFDFLENPSKGGYRYASTNFAPEPSMGYFLGIFGSAFAVSAEEIARMMLDVNASSTGIKGILHKITTYVAKIPSFKFTQKLSPGGNTRLFPAEILNPAVTKGSPFYGQRSITVVDAAMADNVPFWPLLRPERKVDIIIAFDVSGDAGGPGNDTIEKAERLARERNLPFPKIVSSKKYTQRGKQWVTVFDEYDAGKTGPIVLYLPLIDNPQGDNSGFALDQCMKSDCITFNFKYTPENIDGLSALGKQIGEAAIPFLAEAINKKRQEKQKLPVARSRMISFFNRQFVRIKRIFV